MGQIETNKDTRETSDKLPMSGVGRQSVTWSLSLFETLIVIILIKEED
jgi:hypothetical protein